MIVHPQYDENGYVNDIALIKLEHDVREASPACLYDKDGEKDQIVSLAGTGLPATASGAPACPMERCAVRRFVSTPPTARNWHGCAASPTIRARHRSKASADRGTAAAPHSSP
jgi:hypothetical protein